MCALFCDHGFKTGSDGCPICACGEPSFCKVKIIDTGSMSLP